MSKFEDAFYGELEKTALGMKSYPKPGTDKDKKHWYGRRLVSTAAGPISGPFSALAARKGRKLRTLGGSLLGAVSGGAIGQGLSKNEGVARLAARFGSGVGAYLGHGKYDKKVSKREYEIWKAKQRAKGKK